VRIAGGPFDTLEATVARVMPGKMRAAVLLEFLGRQATVELTTETLLRVEPARLPMFISR
jgi:transcription antitermination factor NusG